MWSFENFYRTIFLVSFSIVRSTSSFSRALMATASPPVNLWALLSESKRIINAHSRHFLALSVLFLLPLCFSVTVYPSVFCLITDQSAASHNSVSLLQGIRYNQSPSADGADTQTVVLLLIAYIVVVTVFSLLAIGSIAYSVFQGFYGRPVKLISAVKSSFTSFFPLLATLVSCNFIILGISLILGFATFLFYRLIELILSELDYASLNFKPLFSIVMFISIAIMIRLHVKWILAWIIVVVESTWGLTPLKRSKILIKETESVSTSILFFSIVIPAMLVWISTAAASAQSYADNGNSKTEKLWTNTFFVFQIVITSAFLTLLTLYNLAATTVMYMHCKAAHGELAWEIAEEFSREYVSLPFDDGKVPHLVSVAYNNV